MDPGESAIRVIIVDDSALFRSGLANLLKTVGVAVCAEAASVDEALARIPNLKQLDVVIMDIRMPQGADEGLRGAREIRRRFPQLPIVLLSAHVEIASAARLFDQVDFAVGYLLKDNVDNVESLVEQIRRVVRGEMVIDPEVIQGLFRHRRNVNRLSQFKPREVEILQRMAEGRTNASIAAQLHLSIKTIDSHVAAIFGKLGLVESAQDNRRVLAVLAWLRSQAG